MTPPKVGAHRYFRFDKSVYANALVHEGKIRITTIGRCRGVEAGYGRSDDSENMLFPSISMCVSRPLPEGRENEAPFCDWINKEGFRQVPEGQFPGPRLLMKARYGIEFDVRSDLFVYCVSRFQTRRMEIRFTSGDDSWVEIFDADGFFGAIDNEMARLGHKSKGLETVWYRSRRFPSTDGLPDDAELIKEPQFASEHEARARWIPAALPIERLDLVIPELKKYCRIQRKVLSTRFPLRQSNDYVMRFSARRAEVRQRAA
jgi:hypothetical protein